MHTSRKRLNLGAVDEGRRSENWDAQCSNRQGPEYRTKQFSARPVVGVCAASTVGAYARGGGALLVTVRIMRSHHTFVSYRAAILEMVHQTCIP